MATKMLNRLSVAEETRPRTQAGRHVSNDCLGSPEPHGYLRRRVTIITTITYYLLLDGRELRDANVGDVIPGHIAVAVRSEFY